jgi:hypothetical protein
MTSGWLSRWGPTNAGYSMSGGCLAHSILHTNWNWGTVTNLSKRSKEAIARDLTLGLRNLYLDRTLQQLGKNDSRIRTKEFSIWWRRRMKNPFSRSRPQETRQMELEDLIICKAGTTDNTRLSASFGLRLLRYGFPQWSMTCCLASFCSCPPTPGIFSGVSPSRFSCKRGRVPQSSTAPWG